MMINLSSHTNKQKKIDKTQFERSKNFLATETTPVILWLPKTHSKETQKLLDQRKALAWIDPFPDVTEDSLDERPLSRSTEYGRNVDHDSDAEDNSDHHDSGDESPSRSGLDDLPSSSSSSSDPKPETERDVEKEKGKKSDQKESKKESSSPSPSSGLDE